MKRLLTILLTVLLLCTSILTTHIISAEEGRDNDNNPTDNTAEVYEQDDNKQEEGSTDQDNTSDVTDDHTNNSDVDGNNNVSDTETTEPSETEENQTVPDIPSEVTVPTETETNDGLPEDQLIESSNNEGIPQLLSASTTDGQAYAVLTDDGDLIFFRSFEEYLQSDEKQNVSDIYNNEYSGIVFVGIESLNASTNNLESIPWYNNKDSITSVSVADNQIIKPKSTSCWFHKCMNLVSFDSTGFDTSLVKDMSWMFYQCYALADLDLLSFDTSNVQSMGSMFLYCTSLESIDVSSFNTSNVTAMWSMFNVCSSLKSLDLSNFNTSKATNMGYMFGSCSSLTSLDISSFDTSNVTFMEDMFNGSNNLLSVSLGSKFTVWADNARLHEGTWENTALELKKSETELQNQFPNHRTQWAGEWILVSDYSINYELNGGSLAEDKSNPETYNTDSDTFTLNNPAKQGYTFLGWTGTELSEPALEVKIFKGSYGDRSYTANYKANTYSISYELNGGTNDPDNITSHTYDEDSFTLLEPSRDYYSFIGWYLNDEKITVITSQLNEDITLEAGWTPVSYEIAYTLNGGSLEEGKTNPDTYSIETENFTLNNPSKEYYDFKGWTGTGLDEPTIEVIIPAGSTGDREYIANWQPKTHITYHLFNGINNPDNPESFVFGGDDVELKDPQYEGHSFDGWYLDEEYEEPISIIDSRVAGDVEVYAKWIPHVYTILFIANNGTDDTNNQNFVYGEEQELKENEFISLYRDFVGWSLTPDGEPVYTDGQAVSNLTVNDNETVELYAIWKDHDYQIIYNNMFDAENSNPSSYTFKNKSTISLKNPTRTGYVFAGWFADENLTLKITGINRSLAEDVSIYAKWSPIKYSISFNVNKGKGSVGKLTNILYDQDIVLPNPNITRNGYIFTGWNTKADGSGNSYFDLNAEYRNLSSKNGSTVVLYAQWQCIRYEIAFDPNGGSGYMQSMNVDFDSSVNLYANEFMKNEHAFVGWALDPTGKVKYKDQASVKNLTNIEEQTVTLYAMWVKDKYNVMYNPNGGTGIMNPTLVSRNQVFSLSNNTFKRKGYVFAGWKDINGATYKNKQKITDVLTENSYIVMYAQWVPVEYKITYQNMKNIVNENTLSYTVEDEPIELINPVRTGYTFEGWFYDSACKKLPVENIDTNQAKNLTVYAKWTPNKYTVHFDPNGITDKTTKDQTFTYDKKQALSANAFVVQDKVFTNWNTEADGSGLSFNNRAQVLNLLNGNGETLILYAQYRPYYYSITFNANGGAGKMNKQTLFSGVDGQLDENMYYRKGYRFAGWNTVKNPTASNPGIPYNDCGTINREFKKDKQNLTLYAQWELIEYTVELIDLVKGEAEYYIYTIVSPTKDLTYHVNGLVFYGWYSEFDEETQMPSGAKITKIKKGQTGDITLYCYWEIANYKINYKLNGGTNNTNNPKTYTIFDEVVFYNPTRKGYCFEGWYLNSSFKGDRCYGLGEGSYGDFTFYAKWTSVSVLKSEREKLVKKAQKADDEYMTVYLKYYEASCLENEKYDELVNDYQIALANYKRNPTTTNKIKMDQALKKYGDYRRNNMPATDKISEAKKKRDSIVNECNARISEIDNILTENGY